MHLSIVSREIPELGCLDAAQHPEQSDAEVLALWHRIIINIINIHCRGIGAEPERSAQAQARIARARMRMRVRRVACLWP